MRLSPSFIPLFSDRGGCARRGAAVENVHVDLCGLDVLVAEQLLHGADVVACFEQVGGKAMTEGVRADGLADASLARRFVDGLLHLAGVQVKAIEDAVVLRLLHGQHSR